MGINTIPFRIECIVNFAQFHFELPNNCGFLVIDELARRAQREVRTPECQALTARVTIERVSRTDGVLEFDVRVEKAPKDHRPESHKIYVDTIVCDAEPMKAGKRGWPARMELLAPQPVFNDFDAMEAARAAGGGTLALFKPRRFTRLEIKATRNSATQAYTLQVNCPTITLAPTNATLTAGTYYFAEKVEKAGEVLRVGSGRVTVEPNLATALAGDLQSPNERMLKAVNAVIEARLGTSTGVPKDVEAYSIDGIAVTKIPLERLMILRTQLSTTVARERRGGGIGRLYRYTFTGARNEQ